MQTCMCMRIGMCTQHGMPEHVLCARAQHACLAAWRVAECVPITPCMKYRCMPAVGMVSLDTVVRVWGAGRAGDSPKLISSRSANAPQMCLKWAVRAGMGKLPPHLNSPSRSFACPPGCAMPGSRSGGCESVLIHRFPLWHTTRAYTSHACHERAEDPAWTGPVTWYHYLPR